MLHTHVTAVSSTRSSPWPAAIRSLSWQAAAVTAYRQTERTDRDRRRGELASRILEVTGQSVETGSIYVDAEMRTAPVAVGDVVFQLRHAELLLVRPCVRCDAGRFTSAAIDCVADLDHALAVWEPRCREMCPGRRGRGLVPQLLNAQ
jgi:hypothetical protein